MIHAKNNQSTWKVLEVFDTVMDRIKRIMIKNEYFSSPVYAEDKPEWIEKLNNLSEPHIKKGKR